MAIRDRARRRPFFDALERRETPSGLAHHVAAVAHVHEAATAAKATAFSGHGAATQVGFNQPQPASGVEYIGAASGTAKPLGKFTASVTLDVQFDGQTFSNEYVIKDAAGDTLTLDTQGKFANNFRSQSPVTVSSGTGAFANVAGSGTVTQVYNPTNGSFKFRFHGKYTA